MLFILTALLLEGGLRNTATLSEACIAILCFGELQLEARPLFVIVKGRTVRE